MIAPLDVIKIRLQLQIHSLSDPLSVRNISGPVYKGTLGTLKQILREEGITGLWKGNIPAEVMYLTYGSIQFSAYTSVSHLLDTLPQPLFAPAHLQKRKWHTACDSVSIQHANLEHLSNDRLVAIA